MPLIPQLISYGAVKVSVSDSDSTFTIPALFGRTMFVLGTDNIGLDGPTHVIQQEFAITHIQRKVNIA